jgi:hypothetical protein
VLADLVLEPSSEPLDRLFEPLVLERGDLPAVLADEVMVMLSAGLLGFVAGGGADVDAADQVQLPEQLERPVDARDPDRATAGSHVVENLLRGEATGLTVEYLEDGCPRTSAAVAGALELAPRMVEPAGSLSSGHGWMIAAIDTDNHYH